MFLGSSRLAALAVLTLVPDLAAAQERPSIAELVAQVAEERDGAERAIFETLAQGGDNESFEALKRCVGYLTTSESLSAACEAFRHFRATDLERKAVAWLAARSSVKDQPLRRAAVRGLTTFGDPARDALEKLARTGRYDEVRHIATGALVPALRASGTTEALEFLLDGFRIPDSGPRRLALGTFRAFRGEDVLNQFARRLGQSGYPLDLKLVLVEVVRDTAGEEAERILRRVLEQTGQQGLDLPGFGRELSVYGYDGPYEPEVVVAAMEALTARESRDHERDIERLEGANSRDIRRAALVAQGPLQANRIAWLQRLFELARHSDSALREGAVIALAQLGTPAALEALNHFVRDAADSVRFEAYCAVGDLRRKGSIPILIERLGAEVDHLRWAPHWELRMLTGEDYGTSPKRWNAWWQDAGAAFALPTHEEALLREEERRKRKFENVTRASFYGLEVASDRVCMVLDVSVSMKAQTPSRETRLRVVERQLISLLGRYPIGHRFNIIFFAGDLVPFRQRLVVLDEATRREAMRFVFRQEFRWGTAVYDALDSALADPDVEAIYLLTDGEPTTGKIKSVQGIVNDIRRRTEDRAVKIHGVAVGDRRKLLQDLAEVTGGEYIEAE